MNISLVNNFCHIFGIDRAGLINFFSKIMQIPGRLGSILLVSFFLTPDQQGFFFTIFSLIALQQFFDLSLNIVIINTASHFWPKLDISNTGVLVGDQQQLARLQSLCRFLIAWYGIGGIVFIIIVGLGGYFFLSQRSEIDVLWQYPWIFIVILVAINLPLAGLVCVLEGCNQVESIYIARFFQAILGLSLTIIIFVLGLKMWATCALPLSLVISNMYLLFKYRNFFSFVWEKSIPTDFSWKTDILPLHWRVGVQAIFGYFSNHFITPVLFLYQGPIVAGKFGLTWQILIGIQLIAFAFFQAKIPTFGGLAAQQRYKELDPMVIRTSITCTGLAVLGGLGTYFIVYILHIYQIEIAQRVLGLQSYAVLMSALLPLLIIQCTILYVRTYRKEPFLILGVVSSIILGTSTYLLGINYEIFDVCIAYTLIHYIVILPWSIFTAKIFLDSR